MSDTVYVRRQPMSEKIAGVPFDKLHGLRWGDQVGGEKSVQRRTGQWFIMVHFDCTEIVHGDIAHSCTHGAPLHRIRACVCKKDNDPAIYKKLLGIVGPKPESKPMTNAEFKRWRKEALAAAHREAETESSS